MKCVKQKIKIGKINKKLFFFCRSNRNTVSMLEAKEKHIELDNVVKRILIWIFVTNLHCFKNGRVAQHKCLVETNKNAPSVSA